MQPHYCLHPHESYTIARITVVECSIHEEMLLIADAFFILARKYDYPNFRTNKRQFVSPLIIN